jgi:hypothetical protein
MGGSIKHPLLQTTGNQDNRKGYFVSTGQLSDIKWTLVIKMCCICTDGAKAMTGRHSGVVTACKQLLPTPLEYTAASSERLLLPWECLTA